MPKIDGETKTTVQDKITLVCVPSNHPFCYDYSPFVPVYHTGAGVVTTFITGLDKQLKADDSIVKLG